MRNELRKRLVKEYRNAADKMRETPIPARKLFYFSVLFSETQRVLNWQWDRELVLVYTVAYHTHAQINTGIQTTALSQALPVDWNNILVRLEELTNQFADSFEKQEGVLDVLQLFAELAYAVSGNGSYLLDKGDFKL